MTLDKLACDKLLCFIRTDNGFYRFNITLRTTQNEGLFYRSYDTKVRKYLLNK